MSTDVMEERAQLQPTQTMGSSPWDKRKNLRKLLYQYLDKLCWLYESSQALNPHPGHTHPHSWCDGGRRKIIHARWSILVELKRVLVAF